MSLLTSGTNLTYSDYEKIEGEHRYELYNGELVMVPAPGYEHQSVSSKLYGLLWNYIREKNLGELLHPPTDVKLSENTVVQPDLLFISNENNQIISEKNINGAPDLLIEIISPSSKYRDSYEKKELYEKYGVEEYWLVDPGNKNIEVFSLDKNNKYILYSEGFAREENHNIKSKVLVNFELNLREIFTK